MHIAGSNGDLLLFLILNGDTQGAHISAGGGTCSPPPHPRCIRGAPSAPPYERSWIVHYFKKFNQCRSMKLSTANPHDWFSLLKISPASFVIRKVILMGGLRLRCSQELPLSYIMHVSQWMKSSLTRFAGCVSLYEKSTWQYPLRYLIIQFKWCNHDKIIPVGPMIYYLNVYVQAFA